MQNGRYHNLKLLKDALYLYDVDQICLAWLFCISNTLIHSEREREREKRKCLTILYTIYTVLSEIQTV